MALRNSGDFSEQYPDDPRYFNYEVESGMVTDWNDRQKKDNNLSQYIGKGIRITSYNGFETDRVVVPKEINGLPVISIGENAFKNASFSELVLPSSLKVILKNAFDGCTNLKHIDLPEELKYLGQYCFCKSGLESVYIPNSIEVVSDGCFNGCKDLYMIALGNRTKVLGYGAFSGCLKLNKISLPETVNTIEPNCFNDTAVKTLIVPSSVSKISHEIFGSRYSRRNNKVTCVFLGKETLIECGKFETLLFVDQIYCLPGSNIQKFAREHSIPMKPLSEFDVKSI